MPLVKDGVEWGWLNFYREFDSEPLLVDTNYLADLFRREFTDAAATDIYNARETVLAMAMTAENALIGFSRRRKSNGGPRISMTLQIAPCR